MPEEVVSQQAIDIARIFADLDLRWKIGGEKTVPNAEDVQAVLDRAKFEVEYQAVNSHLAGNKTVVMNHLLFRQEDDGSVRVYLDLGEIK